MNLIFAVHSPARIWRKVTYCNKDVHSLRCFPKQQLPSVLDIKHSRHTRHIASFGQEFMSLPSFFMPFPLAHWTIFFYVSVGLSKHSSMYSSLNIIFSVRSTSGIKKTWLGRRKIAINPTSHGTPESIMKIFVFGFYFQCAEVFDVKLGGVVKVPKYCDIPEWAFFLKKSQTTPPPNWRNTALDEVRTCKL